LDWWLFGVQGRLWTEYMPSMKHVEYMAFPRVCALAEPVWLPQEKKDYPAFLERLKIWEKRFNAAGINYRSGK